MKIKRVFAIPVLLMIIMLVSVFSRYMLHKNVVENYGSYFTDPQTGLPYLTEMDSYYHLRMTKDINELGHPGRQIVDGEPWDSMSYAPEGRAATGYRPLMSWITIGVYRISSSLTGMTLDQTAYWLNMFMSALVVIPIFLLALETGNLWGAFVSAVLAALNYGYFLHTIPGFFDTDGVIAWVSCFFFYFACMAVKKAAAKEYRALAFHGAGLLISFIALYNSWYIYYMFAGLFALALLIYIILTFKKGEAKASAVPAGIFAAVCLAVVILEPGIFERAFNLVSGIFRSSTGLFPNIFVSISELRKPALVTGGLAGLFQMKVLTDTNIGIINAVGGIVPFLTAIVMCPILIRRIVRKNISIENILLPLWFAVTLVLAFRGWRFIMLLALPVALLAGNAVSLLSSMMDEGKMMDKGIYKVMIIIVMTFPALYGVSRASGDSVPSASNAMVSSLYAIRDSAPEDTVLISWWDYGYVFEEKAGRATLFDGGSQSGIRSYWVSKALATKDEKLSANILRMLLGSGDKACTEMLDTFGENEDTLVFMDELLSLDAPEAEKLLAGKESDPERRAALMALLFPENTPPAKYIITPDMSKISGWFATFGMSMGKDKLPAESYSAIMDGVGVSAPVNGKTVYKSGRGFNLILEKTEDDYSAYTSFTNERGEEPLKIDRVLVRDLSGYREFAVSQEASESQSSSQEAGLTWTVIIESDGHDAKLSLVTRDMADSVFGKLFYLGGEGLEHYAYDPLTSGATRVYDVR